MTRITEQYKVEKDNQYVYLNSLRLKGVQNVSASYQKNISLIDYFGNNEIVQAPNGEPNAQCTINSLYLTSDLFISYTGDIGSNLYLLRSQIDQDYDFSFSSGYMVSYSQQCGIGEIPSISTNWQIYGNIGTLSRYREYITNESGSYILTENGNYLLLDSDILSENESQEYYSSLNSILTGNESELADNIVGYNSIGLSIDDFSTNRVSQYSFTIQSQRNPKYELGKIRPRHVLPVRPIQIDINFDFEIDRYELDSMRQDPCNPTAKNITITAKNYKTKNTILSYSFTDMKLIGESYSSNTESYVTVSATYRTFLN